MRVLAATALATLALAGCAAGSGATGDTGGRGTARGCRARGALPDPRCTPGAVDARVDQADVRRTICIPGFTRRVRPPVSYTDGLKRRQLRAYGFYAGRSPRAYE